MKPNAIIFTSNTGYTGQYAKLLGDKTGLPVYELSDAVKEVPRGSGIIYLGWLMAGKLKGYNKAAKLYHTEAVCGVGMGATGSQLQDVRKTNRIPPDTPVFTMQGGFDLARLRGIYRLMMTVMAKTAGRGLAEKKDRTSEEDAMLELMLHGGSYVSEKNLASVLEWYEKKK